VSVEAGKLRIAFRCDASAAIGGGHVMRCLTLASAVSEADAVVTFVAAQMPEALAARITDAGHRLEFIAAPSEMEREGERWEEPPLSADAQLADAKATETVVGETDWIVADHYLLDAHWHKAARGFAGRILVIDDLANRPYDCDILLDQTFGRSAGDYRALVPGGAKILAGAAYALLRPEFARERPAALDRRETGASVRRILVSMGTADPGGITARIVEQVLAAAPQCAIDVVLGPQAASLDQLRALAEQRPGISIHVDRDRMAELMRDADLAIGAAGSTSWERCCLGLPAIAFALADNQRLAAENLEKAGAVVLARSSEDILPLLQSLLRNEQRRFSMIAAAAAITDGNGTQLVVEVVTERTSKEAQLALRPARLDDSQIVWLWRNDYKTRRSSQTNEPIPWPDHASWWPKALESADRHLFIAELAGVPVAFLRFDRAGEGEFEVSINLAPSARGSGLGGRILADGCSAFRKEKRPVKLLATINRDNPASLNIFGKLGFVRSGALSNSDFERYELAEGTVA
jgi:UDP-2,4-diacetamido-2,4,6-trideoxy-beta-L-altropyranose hydrolase